VPRLDGVKPLNDRQKEDLDALMAQVFASG